MLILKSQFQEITLGITKEGVIKMREKVEEFEANKKAAEILHATYPKLTKVFQRKSGTYEIKLTRNKNITL